MSVVSPSVPIPLMMKIGMWFAGVFVICTTTLLTLSLFGIGSFTIGGEVVERQVWLRVAIPVLSLTSVLMGIIAYGFHKEKAWSRHIVMLLWASIGFFALFGLAFGIDGVPRVLLWRACAESVVFGGMTAWYFYRKKNVVGYFRMLIDQHKQGHSAP